MIGDAWFGSLKTAGALMERGTFCIMNLKLCKKNFPLDELKSLATSRGEFTSMKVNIGANPMQAEDAYAVYGSIHVDKQPMVLVHTCSTLNSGEPRRRNWCKYVGGKMVRRSY